MQRREFSEEFRLEAVKLARRGEVPVSQIARDLGIHDSVHYRWIRRGSPGSVPNKDDVPRIGGLPQWLLRLAQPSGK